MPRGDKSAYTDKQKRQARHIEESYEAHGRSVKTAARAAWATVNKQDGGGKKKVAKKKATTSRAKSTASSRSRSTPSRTAKKATSGRGSTRRR